MRKELTLRWTKNKTLDLSRSEQRGGLASNASPFVLKNYLKFNPLSKNGE